MKKSTSLTLAALSAAAFMNFGCATAPTTTVARDELHDSIADSLKRMESEDPNFRNFLDQSYAYAVFPTVGKGGIGVGGAYGRGEVFEHGKFIGYTDISQGTLGAQLGGQSYAEVIAFERPWALQRFEAGQFALSANASAVAINSGAAATAKYENGVAVFVDPTGGLMFEASIGGQDFSFEPE